MRTYLCAGVALVLAVVVAGCGGSNNGRSGSTRQNSAVGSSKSYPELRWGETPFPGGVDWQKSLWITNIQVESLVVQDLVEFTPSGALKPGLASSIEQPSPTTYVYNIRTGVKFSDGHPLTVADVVYSLDQNMVNKESAMKSYWEDVASVSSRGSSAVVVKLKRPDATWPQVVAFSGQIYEKAAAEKAGEKALGTPGHMLIGTGPWKFDSFTPEASVHLSRNPYWSGPPQPAAKVSFTFFKSEASMALALRSGAIDGTSAYNTPKLFTNVPSVHQLSPALRGIAYYLAINTAFPPFNNVHVRRAIAYATDVKGMIKALFPTANDAEEDAAIAPAADFGGFNSTQVAEMFGALPKYEYNLAAAKRELAKSAYPHGFSTEIEALAQETIMLEAAEVLASDLAKIGIAAKVHVVQPSESVGLYGNKVKILTGGFGSLYRDPEGYLSTLLPASEIEPPSLNDGNTAAYRNAEVNKLLVQEREALSPTSRLKLIGKLLRIVGSDAPYRPLYSTPEFASLSNKYVYPQASEFTEWYTPWAMDVKLAK
jgi:peptide/nickel transport system substrate-binding protein